MTRRNRWVGMWRLALLLAAASSLSQPAAAQGEGETAYAFEDMLTGDETLTLRWPTAVAAAGVDEIAVADAAGPRLVVFRDRGGGDGWQIHAVVELPAPAFALVHCPQGYLISTRRPETLLAVAAADGSPRELSLPEGITPGAVSCLAEGGLLVHDLAAGRLVFLDEARTIRTTVELEESVDALAPGPGGGFYAALPVLGEVRRYGANGDELSSFDLPASGAVPAWPAGLAVEASGEIIVVDRHNGRILVLEASGGLAGSGSRKGWEPGLLRFPADLARLPDRRVVVADQGNGRVQIFRRLER